MRVLRVCTTGGKENETGRRGNQRRGPYRLHSSGTRVFKHGYPRECRSTTDPMTRTQPSGASYKSSLSLFLFSVRPGSTFVICSERFPPIACSFPLMSAPSHGYTAHQSTESPCPFTPSGSPRLLTLPPRQPGRPGRPSWRHPVWQDRPTDKGGGARSLCCHVLGLRAAPTFGPKDKSDERASRRGVLRRLPVCYRHGAFHTHYASSHRYYSR